MTRVIVGVIVGVIVNLVTIGNGMDRCGRVGTTILRPCRRAGGGIWLPVASVYKADLAPGPLSPMRGRGA